MRRWFAALLFLVAAAVPAQTKIRLFDRVTPNPGGVDGDVYYTCNSGADICRLGIGTNGYVLTLAAGLPVWLPGGGGGSSPLTTKGDVWGYSSVDARIPIGTNGQAFIADSTQTLGLKWGTLGYAGGGTNATTSWTAGSVFFAGASAFAQDNSNLFYDSTNHWLSIGVSPPVGPLTIQDNRAGIVSTVSFENIGAGDANLSVKAPSARFAGIQVNSARIWNFQAVSSTDPTTPSWLRICDLSAHASCLGTALRFGIDTSGNQFMQGGALTVGSLTATTNAQIAAYGGGLFIGTGAGTLGASIDVGTIYGGGGRFTRFQTTGSSVDALNIMASQSSGGSTQNWAWGPTLGNVWRTQSGTSLSGNAGLNIDSSGRVGANVAAASPGDLSTGTFCLFGSTSGSSCLKVAATGSSGTTYVWPSTAPTTGNTILDCGVPSASTSTCTFTNGVSGGAVTSISTTAPVTGCSSPCTTTATIAVSDFVTAGGSHARGTVPDPGVTLHSPPWLLGEDATFHNPAVAGGGNFMTFAAAGSEPGSPNTGDMNFPTNGYVQNNYDGSSWYNRNVGPTYPLVYPPASWTWVNQGSASVTTNTGSGIYLSTPAAAGVSFHAQVRTISPNTSVRGYILPLLGSTTTTQGGTGLVLRESGSGKVCIFILYQTSQGNQLYVQYGTSFTAITTTHLSAFLYQGNVSPLMMRIDPTGTNMLFYVSSDGQNWWQIDSLAKATPFTTAPDQWGWAVQSNSATWGGNATLIHWKEQ